MCYDESMAMKVFKVLFFIFVLSIFVYSMFYYKVPVSPLGKVAPKEVPAPVIMEMTTYEGIVNFDGSLYEAYSNTGMTAEVDERSGTVSAGGAPAASDKTKDCKT